MILGTAGHIDHGKTALVRALTGIDTDRLPEEKRRGITIDLGFAPLVMDGVGTVAIVDVPGHENFVRTMLAGASGIDMALFVVAADEGLMPQSREHLDILSLLGISRGIVAITKCDLVDTEWRNLVRADVESALAGTPLKGAPVIHVSVRDGSGLSELKAAIARAAAKVKNRRRTDDLFRMPVDRAFSIRGTGTVVTGTIWSGAVSRDSTLLVQPGGKVARVRAVQTHGMSVDVAVAGQRAAIALAGCEVSEVGRGVTLLDDRHWVTTRELEATIAFIDPAFTPGPRVKLRLHSGTAETNARITQVTWDEERRTMARIRLDDPMILRGRDRFVLRTLSPPVTVGGGEVLDPYPPRKGRSLRCDVGSFIEMSGLEGAMSSTLAVRSGLCPDATLQTVGETDAVVVGERVFAGAAISRGENAIEEAIAAEIGNHSLEGGVTLHSVRSAQRLAQDVFDFMLDRLERKKRIAVEGSRVRPFGWTAKLDESDTALRRAIMHEICIRPSEPPSVGELAAKHGARAHAMLKRLAAENELEKVCEDRYYAVGAVSEMLSVLERRLERGRIYSPAELREVLGVTRKYLIPFLEFSDRKGVTERVQQGRSLRAGRGAKDAVSGESVRPGRA